MQYGQEDISNRIRATLPAGWFGDDTPILGAILSSLASGWLAFFNLLSYTLSQTRIASASDFWLDFIASDFFGQRLTRRQNEDDSKFRIRIGRELVRDRCTRASVYQYLADATGVPPRMFEPTNTQDTACYGSMTAPRYLVGGYGAAGGWGSLALPFQSFVVAFRPLISGISNLNGWGDGAGGFGTGSVAYALGNISLSQISDLELFAGISNISPAGSEIWTMLV